MKKVLVGLSGGVDSTISACLLKDQGYDVYGAYFLLWSENNKDESTRIKKVAKKLDIKFKVINAKKDFKERVIKEFISEYKQGLTPNPCVFCNKEFKFNLLLEYAQKNGIDFIATGHYAKSKNGNLFRGKDKTKDQSYFLQRLKKEDLKKIIFPLEKLTKKEVKEIAKQKGLSKLIQPTESQDLCFLSDTVQAFLKKNLSDKFFKSGKIIHKKSAKEVGTHEGIANYTIGQRAKISGQKKPLFIHSIDLKNNVVFVSDEKDLFKKSMQLRNCSWVSGNSPKNNSSVLIQIRHRAKPIKAKMQTKKDTANISFETDVRAITPGQHAAIYKGNEVLGGGVIVD